MNGKKEKNEVEETDAKFNDLDCISYQRICDCWRVFFFFT